MSATGSGYEVGRVPDRTASDLERRASDVGRAATERLAEVRDVTAERLSQAGETLRSVANEVEVEQFVLRGSIAEHPFRIEIEGEDADRYMVFEFNFRTDAGDTVRFTGRKHIGAWEGPTTFPETSTSARDTVETRGGL